ncbi:hypothetical protein LTR17_018828 [Elasticomyces elasticus]|nr:hypothetical protein LTR17_018828 [Elasticomyces elasticus]
MLASITEDCVCGGQEPNVVDVDTSLLFDFSRSTVFERLPKIKMAAWESNRARPMAALPFADDEVPVFCRTKDEHAYTHTRFCHARYYCPYSEECGWRESAAGYCRAKKERPYSEEAAAARQAACCGMR